MRKIFILRKAGWACFRFFRYNVVIQNTDIKKINFSLRNGHQKYIRIGKFIIFYKKEPF